MNHTEDIEKLFSNKFDSFEVKTSKAEWITLNAKLKRLNFLKFSFASFNIYYLSIILVLAGSTAYSTIHTATLRMKIQKLETQVNSNQQMLHSPKVRVAIPDVPKEINKSTERNPLPANVDFKPKPISENIKKTAILMDLVKNDTVKPEKTINAIHDTLKSAPGQPADSSIKIRKIKKTVFLKPRSIVLKDTIVVPKP